MIINDIKRPWIKKTQVRYNPDPFYRSNQWKYTRINFRQESTLMPDGTMLPNTYCYECYIETNGMKLPGRQCDHILAIKLGGDRLAHSNLRTLCDSHHAVKSANEGK